MNDLEFSKNLPHQIILKCSASEPIKLSSDLFSFLQSDIQENIIIEEDFLTDAEIIKTQIYKIQQTAGKSAEFINGSNLNIRISKNNEWENIFIEYWIKSKDELINFFNVVETLNNDTLISFSKNNFGFISFPICDNEIARNDVYIGNDSWNYIAVKISNDLNQIKTDVYVNSELSYSMIYENSLYLNEVSIGLNNFSNSGSFVVDRFKIWKFNNSVKLADRNRHFLSYEADSSTIIYQSNFDNNSEFNTVYKTENIEVLGENLNFQKSDAPIFSKAPKLTVNIGSSYNSIVWYVQEYSLAKEFVIEKLIGDGKYQAVYNTYAEDDPLKIYYFTDEVADENTVLYYRVRQINIDDSEVFSPEIKIGNKKTHEFNLSQNYPNPFNPLTNIYVEVIVPAEFEVNIYDLVGNKIVQLNDGFLAQGLHTFEFDGSNLPSGIYFYEVISPKTQVVKKMILAK